MFEESIGSSNEIVSISQSNCFNSGILCNNLLKLNAFKAQYQNPFASRWSLQYILKEF
jgi:hypothetical protein